jgi:hypothetical protein
MAEETIDEMMGRVGLDFTRRAKGAQAKADNMAHDPPGQARAKVKAEKWAACAGHCAKGMFPVDPADPDLAMIHGAERGRAIKEGRAVNTGRDAHKQPDRSKAGG